LILKNYSYINYINYSYINPNISV